MREQGKAGGWRRRAFPGLTMLAGAMLTVGGLSWKTPDRLDPPTTESITVGDSAPGPAATRRASPATPVAPVDPPTHGRSPDSANPTVSSDPTPTGVATRLVIPYLDVDLPIVSDEIEVSGNPDGYPLCDVAQYLSRYSQPGVPGTVYLYAHARPAMLLRLLEASRVDNGTELLGQQAIVYTSDNWLHVYRIFIVKRHTTDFSLADDLRPGEERLVIQTSEGPTGTEAKLQIAAQPISTDELPRDGALPSADPRVCAPGK